MTVLSRALAATGEHRGRCGLFFDFDGTLAPIQEDPAAVRPTPGVVELLDGLSARVRRVGIVSARPVRFLHEQFDGLTRVVLYGVYGMERWSPDPPHVVTDPAAARWEPVFGGLAARARAELPGVLVEDKRLAVALHYRGAPMLAGEVNAWAAGRAAEHGVRVRVGRMVAELTPPALPGKEAVLRAELAGLACAWYFGDDLSDLPAFAALDAVSCAVRVAVGNPETGSEVVRAADLVLAGPADVPALLRRIMAAVATPG